VADRTAVVKTRSSPGSRECFLACDRRQKPGTFMPGSSAGPCGLGVPAPVFDARFVSSAIYVRLAAVSKQSAPLCFLARYTLGDVHVSATMFVTADLVQPLCELRCVALQHSESTAHGGDGTRQHRLNTRRTSLSASPVGRLEDGELRTRFMAFRHANTTGSCAARLRCSFETPPLSTANSLSIVPVNPCERHHPGALDEACHPLFTSASL